MNRRDRRRVERDLGMRRIGRLTRMAIIGALAGTGIMAAGFGNALHLPHLNQNRDHGENDGGSGIQPPAQAPSVPQAPQGPPVSVSGGS